MRKIAISIFLHFKDSFLNTFEHAYFINEFAGGINFLISLTAQFKKVEGNYKIKYKGFFY